MNHNKVQVVGEVLRNLECYVKVCSMVAREAIKAVGRCNDPALCLKVIIIFTKGEPVTFFMSLSQLAG